MKKKGFVYKLSNNINDKVFIGYGTTSLSQVRALHRTNLKYGRYPDICIYEVMREFGYASFTYEVIEYVDVSKDKVDLIERYRYWMKYYESIENGYNEKRGKRVNGNYELTNQGEDHYKAKLTEDDVRNIRFMLDKDVSIEDVADWFDVTQANIYAIKSRKIWKHIS